MYQSAPVQSDSGFLNQLYLSNKVMKKPDILHVDTNSWKLKVDWKILGLAGWKFVWTL